MMKKKIIISIIALAILIPSLSFAYTRERGEWNDWWEIDRQPKYQATGVKRIYDHENKLVCLIAKSHNNISIDCEPSLELNHPLTR